MSLDGPQALAQLQRSLSADGLPSGFEGVVCVVARAEPTRCLIMECGTRPSLRWASAVSSEVEALWVLGAPGGVGGDRELLERFWARYVERQDAVAVRAKGAQG